MSGANGIQSPSDPFAEGVWIYCVADGKSMLALVEGSYPATASPTGKMVTEEELIAEMIEHRSICVTLKRKYVVCNVGFPMKMSATQLVPAFLTAIMAHESVLELCDRFETHVVLHSFTFLSAFSETDRNTWRDGVLGSDVEKDTKDRARRSNVIAPTFAEKAAIGK